MHIPEIIYPGTWLRIEDEDLAFELYLLLHHLGDLTTQAALALTLYENAGKAYGDPLTERERDAAIREEIAQEVREELGDAYYENFDSARAEEDRRIRRRKMELGIPPRAFLHKTPFLHAHSFLYAVDSFGKFLDELPGYGIASDELQALCDQFTRRLPAVRKIRNSALHIEDRSRGYGSWKDKQAKRKMNVESFLGLSNLENNHLCYTIDDGSYQRVPIRADTLAVMVEIANQVLAVFPWYGPTRIEPYY